MIEQLAIEDLGEIFAGVDVAIRRDIKDDRFCGDLLLDRPQQGLDRLIISSLSQQVAGADAAQVPVADRQANIFGEARLTCPEEARHPDRNRFAGLIHRLAITLQHLEHAALNRFGEDVFIDLLAHDRHIVLIDLDHFLDLAIDPAGEEFANGLGSHGQANSLGR